jgi:hypothetical protein
VNPALLPPLPLTRLVFIEHLIELPIIPLKRWQDGGKEVPEEMNPARDAGFTWWTIVRDLRTCLEKDPISVDVLKELLGEAA